MNRHVFWNARPDGSEYWIAPLRYCTARTHTTYLWLDTRPGSGIESPVVDRLTVVPAVRSARLSR